MQALSLYLNLLIILFGSSATEDILQQNAPASMTSYYFIRHAEKDLSDPQQRDPELTEAGKARAKKWAEIFKEVPFDLIVSTNYKRTLQTASVVANSQNKEVTFYDPNNLKDPDFLRKTKGKTVLVVGHSNTNPAFANLLLGQPKYDAIDEAEYGKLIIVHIAADGTCSSQLLNID